MRARTDGRRDGATDTLFRMLADPTRRHIPDLFASGISKHLMGLRSAGLVQSSRQGRRQIYTLEAAAMKEALTPWLRKYDRFWQNALERLRDLAEDAAEDQPPTKETE